MDERPVVDVTEGEDSLQLHAVGVFAAEDVEALILDLLDIRSRMTPPVLRAFPGAEVDNPPHLAILPDPDLDLAASKGASVQLRIRHPGLGWAVVDISTRNAVGLRDGLISALQSQTASSVFTSKLGNSDGSH